MVGCSGPCPVDLSRRSAQAWHPGCCEVWWEWTPSSPPWLIEVASSEHGPIQQSSTWRSRNGIACEEKSKKRRRREARAKMVEVCAGLSLCGLGVALPRRAPQSLPGILNSFLLFTNASSFLPHTQHRLSLRQVCLQCPLLECWHLQHLGRCPNRLCFSGMSQFRTPTARHHVLRALGPPPAASGSSPPGVC